jgi:alkanesulfonate monooxygenase SsuD/methylene tetrahydromethanopterin reductase-like flavin-dependent oxidoreductase (luciferase family)
MGDGWMLNYKTPAEATPGFELLHRYLEENKRAKEDVGIEARFSFGDGRAESWHAITQGWQSVGVTHLSLNTMACGFEKPDEHLKALQLFAQEVSLA